MEEGLRSKWLLILEPVVDVSSSVASPELFWYDARKQSNLRFWLNFILLREASVGLNSRQPTKLETDDDRPKVRESARPDISRQNYNMTDMVGCSGPANLAKGGAGFASGHRQIFKAQKHVGARSGSSRCNLKGKIYNLDWKIRHV